MTLKELIVSYRSEHSLSQRQFATLCGLSNGYISMLEKGINPNTKLPVTPTLPKLKSLASGMNMTLERLLAAVDDMPVDLTFDSNGNPAPTHTYSQSTQEAVELFEQLDVLDQGKIIGKMEDMLEADKYKVKEASCG